MCYLFTCVFRRVSTISRRNTSMYRYAFLKIGVKVISLNPCRKVAAYNFYVLLHFYKQFNREMISGAHLFLDDEDVVSARRKWFISSPFHLALTNSTCQKVAQCMTKHIPIWVHDHHPQSPSKLRLINILDDGKTMATQQRSETRRCLAFRAPLAVANPFHICIFLSA